MKRRRAVLLSRMLHLSWSNLRYSPGRLVLSIATVAAAGLLMFTQLGFLDASLDSQGRVVAQARPDLVVVSRGRASLISDTRFPLERLAQIKALDGVSKARPLYLDSRRFRLRNPRTGRRLLVRVIAVDRTSKTFPEFRVAGAEEADTLLIDRRSKPFLGTFEIGSTIELEGRRYRIAGFFSLGSDFVNDGSVLMTTQNLQRLLPNGGAARLDQVDVGLVSIEPGASTDQILRRARARLPDDVEVFMLRDFLAKEREFWRDHTIVGFVFTLGTLVGLVVGTVICVQLLYSIVWDFRKQFSTLSAIGFQRSFIVGAVASKAIFLAVAGFVPAWIVSSVLYAGLSAMTGLTFEMRFYRSILVFGLTVLMTLIASVSAVQPLLREDPARLFGD